MPRLLILCEYPTLLGGERSMLATLGAVAADGFDVYVAAPPAGPLADELCRRGIAHVPWATHDGSGKRHSLARLRDDLNSMFERFRPDLVHGNSLSTSRVAGPVAASRGVASVGHFRDILRLSPQAVADLNLHCRLIAVSQATRDFHVGQGIDAAKCRVVYNGVDLDTFLPGRPTDYLHRELGVSPEVRFIVTLGQIGLRKGTDLALMAALQLSEEHRDIHWLIVGERTSQKPEAEEFERSLHELANSTALAGRVHFLGSRTDIVELLNEAAVLVHAARQEPLGRVLLEAAACGVAVVATDVGGTREIFPESAQAAEVVGVDPGSIAAAVSSLLQNEDRRRTLGANARRRAKEAFDIRDAAARLIENYRATIAGPR
jgi:glycosyltransferase involved in cell wall biosynthesis